MDSSQVINKAGDINIELIQISTTQGFYQDVTNQVIGIQIFEDIFAPFITGTLEIRDSLDLMNVFPFNGEEFLELKLSTPTLERGNIEGKYYIHKMTNRSMIGDRAMIYTLHFISEEALIDINKKISRTFEGKCSDIAKKVLLDDQNGLQIKRDVNIEETNNATKYISNFWSPVKNLNSICETSINKNGSASYVFYEDRYGFNFVSLESLYMRRIYQTFTYDNYIRDVQSDGVSTVRNVEEDYKRIRDIKIPVAYDYIERARGGMFGSKLYTYDIATKKIASKNYDMLKNYDSQYHLNKYPLASNKAVYRYNSMLLNMTKYTENFSGYGDVTNTSSIQNRVSLLNQINSNKIEIMVPGRLDYTVGLRIEIKLYKVEPISQEDTEYLDEMFSGAYLISAINHYINRNRHECTLELVKESLLIDLDRKK